MTLPTIDEFLASLASIRSGSIRLRDEALTAGDTRAARAAQAQVAKVEKMILQKGGSLEG